MVPELILLLVFARLAPSCGPVLFQNHSFNSPEYLRCFTFCLFLSVCPSTLNFTLLDDKLQDDNDVVHIVHYFVDTAFHSKRYLFDRRMMNDCDMICKVFPILIMLFSTCSCLSVSSF